MATRPLGTGYDPNSGWPPDDSTNVGWGDVDLTGYGNFGPGGFAPNPKLTGPATGTPPGMSLSGAGGNADSLTARPATPADAAAMRGPQMTSGQPNLRPGMSPAVRNGPGPFTDVTPNGPDWFGLAAKALPYAGRVLGPLGAYFGSTTPAETGELPRQRPSGPAAPTPSGIGSDANRPLLGAGGFPTTYGLPGQQPPELSGAPSGGAPIGSPAPAVPPPRPRAVAPVAAGPAAARQQPNLGNYAPIYQPNIARTGNVRGGRSGDDNAPLMGAPDWSRLFQRPQQ